MQKNKTKLIARIECLAPESKQQLAVRLNMAPAQSASQMLAAFWVSTPGTTADTTTLRNYLSQHLPAYMVPSTFTELDAIPLSPNGKTDRNALAAMSIGNAQTKAVTPPTTALQKVLKEIWTEVLGQEAIGIHDDFFQLGGHSLLVTSLVSKVRDTLEVNISLASIFDTPTISELAASLLKIPGEQERLERMAELLVQLAEMSDSEVDNMLDQRSIAASEDNLE